MTGTAAASTTSSRRPIGPSTAILAIAADPAARAPPTMGPTTAKISIFTPITERAMVSAGAVDYRLGDNSSIYVRGLYSHFDNFGDRWVLTPTINSFTTSPTQGGLDGTVSYNASIRRPIDVIGSMVAGGQP